MTPASSDRKIPRSSGGFFYPKRKILLCEVECALARIDCTAAELFLNAQELVVLCHALRTRRCARLDLSRIECDREIGNRRVLRLARAMRRNRRVACLVRHLDRLECLGDGADLVELDKNGVARAELDALLQALRIRDEEIIADELSAFVIAFQPSQSSSSRPSSME